VFNKHSRVMLCRNEVVSVIVCRELARNVSADATVNLYKVQPVPDVYVFYCITLFYYPNLVSFHRLYGAARAGTLLVEVQCCWNVVGTTVQYLKVTEVYLQIFVM
jgi:hypothetical protein